MPLTTLKFLPFLALPQVTKTLHVRISQYAQITLETCAYAGTADVLKVQQLLAVCGEHIEVRGWPTCPQTVATCPGTVESYSHCALKSLWATSP